MPPPKQPTSFSRTGWVYGATGKNFLRTILKVVRERDVLRIVDDQHGAPTGSRELAHLTASILQHCETRAANADLPVIRAVAPLTGIYHATAAEETTWFGFASEILRHARELEPATAFASLEPIATAQYPTPARRPMNSRLNNDKLAVTFGPSMEPWRSALAALFADTSMMA